MAGVISCHFSYFSEYAFVYNFSNKDGDNMADIFLTNGDIDSNIYSDIAVVESYDEITQSAINNVLTVFGENQFHTNIGNMAYKRRLKLSSGSIDIIKNDCKNAILVDERVSDVTSIDAYYDDNNKNILYISFTIKAIDGTMMSSSVIITI